MSQIELNQIHLHLSLASSTKNALSVNAPVANLDATTLSTFDRAGIPSTTAVKSLQRTDHCSFHGRVTVQAAGLSMIV